MDLANGVATAMVTLASVTSIAYQLTTLMIYKAVEASANTAIGLVQRRGENVADTVGEVQFILMELDIEAKFKAVRSLLSSLEENLSDDHPKNEEFIRICMANIRDAMTSASATLLRIQEAMDEHAQQWFSSYRSLHVVDDLHALKAQCRMFDKRLETLIQCLSVPTKDSASGSSSSHTRQLGNALSLNSAGEPVEDETSMLEKRIFGEPYACMDESAGVERMKSIMMAERALKDVKLQEDVYSDTKMTYSDHPTSVLFEDPVFL